MTKKIVIIPTPNLPIPDVKGGGVELLIRLFIDQNEIEKRYQIVCFSVYDREAKAIANNYKNTQLVYIHISKIYLFWGRVKNLFARIFKRERIAHRSYYDEVYKIMSNMKNIDYVMFEAGQPYVISKYRKLIKRNLFFHSHIRQMPIKKDAMFDKVIAISDFCKRDWLNSYQDKDIIVARNGFDSNIFYNKINKGTRISIRKSLSLEEGDFVVVYVGRIVALKGVDKLIDAWKYINLPNVKLMIVGSLYNSFGAEKNYSLSIEKKVKEDERIVLAGYVDNKKLWQYLQSADIQVVPTIGDEAAGIVAVEGMAAGLPLIITESGGMVEYVDNNCAVIIPKDDNISFNLSKEIIKLATNDELRMKMKKAGIRRSQKFSQAQYYQNLTKALGE